MKEIAMMTEHLETKLRDISEMLRVSIEDITAFKNMMSISELGIHSELIRARNMLGSVIMSLKYETEITSSDHKYILNEVMALIDWVKREIHWILAPLGIAENNSKVEQQLGKTIEEMKTIRVVYT
jgi:hypothetical protein